MNKNNICLVLLISMLILLSHMVFAEEEGQVTTFTYRTAESDNDPRPDYEVALIRLALEKTVSQYGTFNLEASPRMNLARCMFSVRKNDLPNFFCSRGYKELYNTYPEVAYVHFPIDLGLLSYRTCFTNEMVADKLSKVNTLDELRQFTYGQGRDWADVEVLKANGFNVSEVSQYEHLFKMTAAGRFDLFCRGTNEVKQEYDIRHDIPGLVYDQHILLYYPLPVFLYTNKNNVKAIERITKGLQIAYADGSLQRLWRRFHQAGVDFAHFEKRKIFYLNNPFIKSIDFDYAKYDFKYLPQ